MNGRALALASAAGLAVAGLAARRGSRSTSGYPDVLPLATHRKYNEVATNFRAWTRRGRPLLEDWGYKHGLKFIGSGEDRAVFGVPEGVLKLAWFDVEQRRGADSDSERDQNTNEASVWREAPVWLRPHLVPVLGSSPDGEWLVMERVKADEGRLPSLDVLDQIREAGIVDVFGQNVSNDGRMLDYGYLDHALWRRIVEDAEQRGSASRSSPVLVPVAKPDWTGRETSAVPHSWFRFSPPPGGPVVERKVNLVNGVFASWAVIARSSRTTSGDRVGLLAGNEIAARDTLPYCEKALDALRRETGAPIRGLFHVGSLELDKRYRGLGIARALYRDMVAVAAEHGFAVAPGACYRDADHPHLGRGSTSPAAQRIWEDLALEYPHARARTRLLLWGGPIAARDGSRSRGGTSDFKARTGTGVLAH